jgi:N utilization substance protein A
MSGLDMSEAVRMLADDKGISVDALLQVLVDALAMAYKRRPGAAAEVDVRINPDTMDMQFIAYDIDEEGNWVNERDDTPDGRAWPYRGADLPSGDEPAHS